MPIARCGGRTSTTSCNNEHFLSLSGAICLPCPMTSTTASHSQPLASNEVEPATGRNVTWKRSESSMQSVLAGPSGRALKAALKLLARLPTSRTVTGPEDGSAGLVSEKPVTSTAPSAATSSVAVRFGNQTVCESTRNSVSSVPATGTRS